MSHIVNRLLPYLLIFVTAGLGASGGCSDNGASPRPAAVPSFVGDLECKPEIATTSDVLPLQDCVLWAYDRETQLLSLNHVNTCLNCCPESEPYAVWDDGTIIVVEDETGGLCHCLCTYDLRYEIANVPRMVITLTVRGACQEPGDVAMQGEIDLRVAEFGSTCADPPDPER